MKKEQTSMKGRFQFKVLPYGNLYYPERLGELRELLAGQPERVDIELMGKGEINGDAALAFRSVLRERWPGTHVAMHARSSLMNGSVLVWLQGDERTIREDAWIFFRGADGTEETPWSEAAAKFPGATGWPDQDEIDHPRVLELINEYLPVKEFAGRLIRPAELRQFGLLENDAMERFLACAFAEEELKTEESDQQQLRSPTDTPQN